MEKLLNLQKNLKLNHGSFEEEFPEQLMSTLYLKGDEKVLEIGGNIGRNSLIISSILNNSNNLVVLESDKNIAKQLEENRNINNLNFKIIDKALSKKPLIQKQWTCIVSDIVLPEYTKVDTITLEELKNQVNINFDTLVLDCEGAFYHILLDMPEILDNINLIIMENDYPNHEHKLYVDDILIKNNFKIDYSQPLEGHEWLFTKYVRDRFYEVWIRK